MTNSTMGTHAVSNVLYNTFLKTGTTQHRRNLRAIFQYLERTYRKVGETVFVWECSDGTRRNDMKLKERRFKLDIWKKLFPLRMVRHWNR